MIIETTSKVYDNDGTVVASYSNAETVNAEDIDKLVAEFAEVKKAGDETPQPTEQECVEETNEPDCSCLDDCFGCPDCDEEENGEEVFACEISVDTLKKVAIAAGCLLGIGITRKLIKFIF